ncbi:MAG: hypothetical protein KJ674_04555 [Nanoarchaeota archaeon]|nr:hypothetical protein [Nanoarchaeota archaeon]
MKKRGVMNLPFVYIFMIIVIAFVLLFGFRMIVKLNDLKEKTVYLTFEEDFKKEVEKMYNNNKGSMTTYSLGSRNKPLYVPKDVNEICINGVRVTPDDFKYESFEVENLRGYNNGITEVCIDTKNGLFNFKLKNDVIGNEVYVLLTAI